MIETFTHEPDLAVRKKRARMRAWRRGMREMDLILGGFIDSYEHTLSVTRLKIFEELLAYRDQDLYAWISGRDPHALTEVTDNQITLLTEIAANWRVIDKNLP